MAEYINSEQPSSHRISEPYENSERQKSVPPRSGVALRVQTLIDISRLEGTILCGQEFMDQVQHLKSDLFCSTNMSHTICSVTDLGIEMISVLVGTKSGTGPCWSNHDRSFPAVKIAAPCTSASS